MAWTFFVVGAAFALLVANALPARREPFTVLSFVFGLVPAELPLHVVVLEAAVAAALSIAGGLSSWPAVAGLALTVASAVGFAGLAVVAHRAGALVDSALDGATGGPVVGPGNRSAPGLDPLVAAGHRRALPLPGDQQDPEHRLLGRRELPAQTRHPPPAGRHRRGAPVLVYIHGGAWVIGDKREQGSR